MAFDVVHLSDIDLSALQLVERKIAWFGEQDHCRWVFRSSRSLSAATTPVLYYKIWNPTHIRRDNILNALNAGFYDVLTTPALRALIFHEGLCRGYVMFACQNNSVEDPSFFELIKQKTRETGYFHVQYSRYHVKLFEGKPSLIDLEGVYPLRDLSKVTLHHSEFDSPAYELFVRRLCLEQPDCGPTLRDQPALTSALPLPASSTRVLKFLSLPSQVSRSLLRRPRRWLENRFFGQVERIER